MDIFPDKILYGESSITGHEKGFATVLINRFGKMKASLTAHSSLEEAKNDAQTRQESYRILFGLSINITNNPSDVSFYLTKD